MRVDAVLENVPGFVDPPPVDPVPSRDPDPDPSAASLIVPKAAGRSAVDEEPVERSEERPRAA